MMGVKLTPDTSVVCEHNKIGRARFGQLIFFLMIIYGKRKIIHLLRERKMSFHIFLMKKPNDSCVNMFSHILQIRLLDLLWVKHSVFEIVLSFN